MSSTRTGYALGQLSPVIYFENASGHLLLAPLEVGHGMELARKIYEEQYRPKGFEWREAGTLNDVDRLQKRLVEQEMKDYRRRDAVDDANTERVHSEVASNLRQRMASSSCSAYERKFIGLYLQLRESKRGTARQRWQEAQMYLWAREHDSGTKVDDRMKGAHAL